MTEYGELIGVFEKALQPGHIKKLVKAFSLFIVKRKDTLVDNCNFLEGENPFHIYETLEMAMATRKKDDKKPFYIGKKITVDKNTKKKTEYENVEITMKKFASITSEVKNGLLFILFKYMKECHDCYLKNGKTFGPEDQILTQITTFAETSCISPITPVITQIIDIIDIEKIIDGAYQDLHKELSQPLRTYFKGSEEKVPDKQLNVIIDAYIKFIKIIAVLMTDILFEKRYAINKTLLCSILRQMNTMLVGHNCEIDSDLMTYIKEYIDKHKPEKKTKSKKDSESGDEIIEDSESDEEKKTKKKTTKKTTKKTKKVEPEPEPESDEESGIDTEDEKPKAKSKAKPKSGQKSDKKSKSSKESKTESKFEQNDEDDNDLEAEIDKHEQQWELEEEENDD